jgi:hypothetical protein
VTYTEADLRPWPQSALTGIPLLREQWELAKAGDLKTWGQEDWVHSGGQLLDPAVVAYLKANQAPPWNCGTKACVAGHIVLAKGARLHSFALDLLGSRARLDSGVVVTTDGLQVDVGDYAAELVGLNRAQARVLFDGGNTAEVIEGCIAALEANPEADLEPIRYHFGYHQTSETSSFGFGGNLCPWCADDEADEAQA